MSLEVLVLNALWLASFNSRFAFSGDVIKGLLDVHGSFGVLHDDGMFEGIHLLHRVDHHQGQYDIAEHQGFAVDFRKQCCCSSIELIFRGLRFMMCFSIRIPGWRLEANERYHL